MSLFNETGFVVMHFCTTSRILNMNISGTGTVCLQTQVEKKHLGDEKLSTDLGLELEPGCEDLWQFKQRVACQLILSWKTENNRNKTSFALLRLRDDQLDHAITGRFLKKDEQSD